MVQDRKKGQALATTVTYVRVAQNAGNLTGCGTVSFPRRAAVNGVVTWKDASGKQKEFET